MLDALTATLVNNADAQINWNLNAIAEYRAYCMLEEPRKTKLEQRYALASSQLTQDDTKSSLQQMLEEMWDLTLVRKVGKVLGCYICAAKAEALGVDDPNYDDSGVLQAIQHPADARPPRFIPAHINAYEKDDFFKCPVCKVTLFNKKRLQNHT